MIKRTFTKFITLTTIVFIIGTSGVYAISPEQQALFRKGIYHYDIGASADICGSSGNTDFATNRGVYVLGDSYGGGYGDLLQQKLQDKGYSDVTINYSSGRSISGKGTSPNTSGLEAVDEDNSKISNKGVIIIELGTNPEQDFKNNQEKLLKKLQTINSSASYYWVNVGNYDDIDESSTNAIIKSNSSGFNYNVIDWKAIAEKKYFEKNDIHPTANGGYEAYANMIANAIPEPLYQSTAGSTGLVGGFYKTDASKTNGERIWQFLTAEQGLGLNAYQAAGVMGNIDQETGGTFSPKAAENGGSGLGRGIIQWTSPGRKQNLANFTNKNGSEFQDALDLQLNFMKHELSTSYKTTLTMLKSSNATTFASNLHISDPIITAALIFHGPGGPRGNTFKVPGLTQAYEGSGDTYDFVINTRGKEYGHKAYDDYSGQSLEYGSSSISTCPNNSGIAGVGGWDLSGANALVKFNQGGNDAWNNARFSGCGTYKQCGCPAISAAIIINTLTSTSIDPAALGNRYPGGASWSNVPTDFGLKRSELGRDIEAFTKAADILNSGGLVMVHIENGGSFIDGSNHSTHFFIIRKVVNGEFYIYFLYEGSYNEKAFTPSDFINGGLTEMWGYTK